MVNKRIEVAELDNVGQLLRQKEIIETLKSINENIITEEEQKKKSKTVDINLVGWTNGEDVIGKEPKARSKKQTKEESEYDTKQSQINQLKDAGLIEEGSHLPLATKKEGEPDVYEEPIRKLRVTSSGSAVLELAENLGIVKGVKNQNTQSQSKSTTTTAQPTNNNNNNNNKRDLVLEADKPTNNTTAAATTTNTNNRTFANSRSRTS